MDLDLEKLIYLIVGAIIGFALSLAKDWFMESKKQKEKEKLATRQRLEELFILLNKYNKNMIMPLQLQNDIEQERLTMLVRFYFPHFKKEFDDYVMECATVTKLKINAEDFSHAALVELPKKLHPLNKLIVKEGQKL